MHHQLARPLNPPPLRESLFVTWQLSPSKIDDQRATIGKWTRGKLTCALFEIGFIGRHLAKYIDDNKLASHLRIVDKVLPQLAGLAPEFSESCSTANFVQADASREPSLPRIFEPPPDRSQWDYVFNLGGETALSQTHEIYKLRAYDVSMTLGREAAKRNVKAFVEASTGMVYAANRTPKKETDKLKPWLKISKSQLQAEVDLSKIEGLNLIILRLPHVYGNYDSGFIAKALCLARVHQELNREMHWLWTKDLRIDTVHVEDVARAMFKAAEYRASLQVTSSSSQPATESTTAPSSIPFFSRRQSVNSSSEYEAGPLPTTPVFNIVDHGGTNQGRLAEIISRVFNIKTGFQGQLISQFARLNLEHVVDDLNEEYLQPWADILQKKGIQRAGPLSPFLEKELLKDRDLSLDGSEFEKVVGFVYDKPEFTEENVREVIASYEKMGWWP